MKKNEKGFGVVEGLLILVVIGIVGFIGWYVLQSSSKTTDNAKGSMENQATTQNPVPNNTHETEEKYLSIKEWGVKFKLEKSVENAAYRFKETGNNWFYVSTPRLDELADQTQPCSGANESVTLNRAKVGDDRFGSPWTEVDLQKIGTKLGEYYYFQEGGQPCFGSEADLAKVTSAMEEIGTIRANLSKLAKTVSKQ